MSTFLKNNKVALLIIIVVIIALCIAGVFIAKERAAQEQAEKEQTWTTVEAVRAAHSLSSQTNQGFCYILATDEAGNDFPKFDIDSMEPGLLDALVSAYNESPESTEDITTEEAAFGLSENFVEESQNDGPAWRFLKWCDAPADLYYTGTIIGDDGTLYDDSVHDTGEATHGQITNYQHSIEQSQGVHLNEVYSWELPSGDGAQ